MKKFFTLVFFSLLGGALWAASSICIPVTPFRDEISRLDHGFAGMNELEQWVEQCHATHSELALENNVLLKSVTNERNISTSLLVGVAPDAEKVLGIPGFYWGFCLGVVGILINYLVLEGEVRKKETGGAWLGCLLGSAISLIIIVISLSKCDWFLVNCNWGG